MKREAVTSETISEMGYDEKFQTLELLYRNGTTYQYFDVPANIYEELRSAGSKGQYINSRIRGSYRYARV